MHSLTSLWYQVVRNQTFYSRIFIGTNAARTNVARTNVARTNVAGTNVARTNVAGTNYFRTMLLWENFARTIVATTKVTNHKSLRQKMLLE